MLNTHGEAVLLAQRIAVVVLGLSLASAAWAGGGGFGSDEDSSQDSGPPYFGVVKDKDGEFKVTMETPSVSRPKPLVVEITASGVSLVLAAPTAIGIATSRPARAG